MHQIGIDDNQRDKTRQIDVANLGRSLFNKTSDTQKRTKVTNHNERHGSGCDRKCVRMSVQTSVNDREGGRKLEMFKSAQPQQHFLHSQTQRFQQSETY